MKQKEISPHFHVTKNMKKSLKLSLLKIVYYNGNLMSIVEQGYEFSQVIAFLTELIKEGYISKSGNNIEITRKGRSEIDLLNSHFGRTKIDKWIEPDEKSKIVKLSEKDVFLPKQNELFFD